MPHANIRFYAELNDHLPQEHRRTIIAVPIDGTISVGEIIAGFEVPVTEVDLVLVNGISVGLSHLVNANDLISVFPVYESFDISSLTKIRERPLREPRFVLDCHLGKLAYYLRMLGLDTLYSAGFHDDDLVGISNRERRTLLSRDRRLIEEGAITRGYRVRETDPKLQVTEILRRFDLFKSARPLQRCLRCNTLLAPIEKGAVLHRLPEMVRELYDEFQTCPTCARVYWKGTHYQRMEEFIARILADE